MWGSGPDHASHVRESVSGTVILALLCPFVALPGPFVSLLAPNRIPCGASGVSGALRPDVMHQMHRLHRFGGGSGGVLSVTPP